MNAYTSGMWIEHRPLCNGDEVDYQRLLQALEGPRSDALALVASALTRMGFVQRDMVRHEGNARRGRARAPTHAFLLDPAPYAAIVRGVG